MRIHHDRLEEFIAAVFRGAGCEREEASVVSNHLVGANLAGHDSHGVIRTPIYIQWMRDGKVFANRKMKVVFESESMARIDGQMGLGQSIGVQALDLGIEKCKSQGVALIALCNSGHLGRIGHWAEMAIEAGFVSLSFVNTTGLGMHVVPAGGIDRRLSVNPITVGIPTTDEIPIVLDLAAAASAEGKLKVARNKGVPVPDGVILDAQGRPTNDPNDFYGPPKGAILPFGGHKGYGLGFVAEILAGALTGGGCSSSGKDRLEQNMLSILVDPTRLQDKETLFGEIASYAKFVRSSRPAAAGGEVLTPGQVEHRNRAQRRADGVELDETTWSQLCEAAQEVGVSAPAP